MKSKRGILAAILAISLVSADTTFAQDDAALNTIADTVVVRPACFLATIVGSAFFVISLPIAAASRSVKKAANVLVVKPARATFTRPLGDMDALYD
jgi:hypothetical protein